MRSLTAALFVLLFAISGSASAAPYVWTLNDSDGSRFTGDSPGAVCSDWFAHRKAKNPSIIWNGEKIEAGNATGTSFFCRLLRTGGGISAMALRSGDSCADPQATYNPAMGSCDPPELPPQECAGFESFGGPDSPIAVGSDGVRRVTGRLESACKNGCQYDITGTDGCFATPGMANMGFCNYKGVANGLTCAADSAGPRPGDDLNPPPTDPGTGPGDGGSGDSGGDGGDNGGDNGGDSGGSNGGNNGGDNDGNNGGNNGGSNGGSGGDSGGSGGNNGGGDGSGSGTGSGGIGGGTGGGGPGTGTGTDPDTGSGGPGGPGAGGVPGVCEEGVCDFVPPEAFGDEPVPSFGESLQSVYKGIQDSPIGQSIQQITFPSGGSCPAGSVRLDALKVTLTFDSHCDLWAQVAPILAAVMLAVWALLAVRVFLSA